VKFAAEQYRVEKLERHLWFCCFAEPPSASATCTITTTSTFHFKKYSFTTATSAPNPNTPKKKVVIP
jgi:hypothetical protein